MADLKHIEIIKQGVEVWHKWRMEHKEIPYLVFADLRNADLRYVDLSGAHLDGADFAGANLRGAILSDVNLSDANLSRANLKGANLSRSDLGRANLYGTNFSETQLTYTNFSHTNLMKANFSRSSIYRAVFGDVDFSGATGLEEVVHGGPSVISIGTIILSEGNIPEIFLRGAGVPDEFISITNSLLNKPINFYSCFISYSSKDQIFAERLHADLQNKNVRCWFAPQDMKTGDEFRSKIDESIHIHDKLLLILSEYSISSSWVKKEVETAFEKERRENKLVLFPIRLDDTVMHTDQSWAADIRRTRHITDFTGWKHHDEYQKAFHKLLGDLKAASG